jgi:hypothetical protein
MHALHLVGNKAPTHLWDHECKQKSKDFNLNLVSRLLKRLKAIYFGHVYDDNNMLTLTRCDHLNGEIKKLEGKTKR